MKLALKDRLVNYLKKQSGYVASGEIQRLVASKTTYTPRTAVRRLEELANAGILEVKYERGHAHYRFNDSQGNPAQALVDFENYQPSHG